MRTSRLFDYSDGCILAKGNMTINGAEKGKKDGRRAAKRADGRENLVILKNHVPFTECLKQLNSTQADNAIDLHVTVQMHNLIQYSNNYSKSSESL